MTRVRIPARALGNFQIKMKNIIIKNYEKNYKKIILIPAIVIIFSIFYMISFYQSTGDFIYKDISLTGGTSVTIQSETDTNKLKSDLFNKLEEINVREIYDLTTREQKAIIIETKSDSETTKKVLEEYFGYELNSENSSLEFTGPSLSESFYKQLIIAIIIAFIFMSLVVFIIFRTFVPSFAVIISAFADILMALVTVNILGIKLSSAGIIAFLMLIGYSVDTDILLTTRLLKREGDVNKKLFDAFKTGITMTSTSLIASLVALIFIGTFSEILKQIFIILIIGLLFDIFNTWITNASILKWYVEKRK